MRSMLSNRISSGWLLALMLSGVVVGGLLVDRGQSQAAEGAASPTPTVIGVVDMYKVLNESKMYKDLKDELHKGAASKREEAQRRRQEADMAQKTMEAFNRRAPQFREKFKAFVDAAVDYNAYVKLSQAEQILLLNKGTWQVYQSILEVVSEVAEERGIDLVIYMDDFEPDLEDTQRLMAQIRQRKVLHRSPRLDLTTAVRERFDQNYLKARASKKKDS